MHTDVSANTRIHLAQSLPAVEREKDRIVNRIAANLDRTAGERANCSHEIAAKHLVHCLVDQARYVVDTGCFAETTATSAARQSFAEAGHKLSGIGDALVPILKDVVGPAISHQTAAAWSTTFWAIFAKQWAQTPELAS